MPNNSQQWSLIATVCLVVGAGMSLSNSGHAIAAALPVERERDQWSSSTRIVVINGREIRVSVSAFLLFITNSPGAMTTVSIRVSSVDGEELPAGLMAEHIRLQRFDTPSRVIHRDLVVTDTLVATPGVAEYFPDNSFITAARGARFRTTVRLATSEGDKYVRMGTIRVNTGTLVSPNPVLQPDLR